MRGRLTGCWKLLGRLPVHRTTGEHPVAPPRRRVAHARYLRAFELDPLQPRSVEPDARQRHAVGDQVLQRVDPPAASAFSLDRIDHLPGLIIRGFAGQRGRGPFSRLAFIAAEPELPGSPDHNQRLQDLDGVARTESVTTKPPAS
ncbi:MAG TPA: hypothetical protein VHJ69_03565 [Gemmatimonadales bacterium]|nr:hypothetical protein [Gemmatimonadales bacterium]